MESAAVADQRLVTGVATQHGSHKGHQPAALVTDGRGQGKTTLGEESSKRSIVDE